MAGVLVFLRVALTVRSLMAFAAPHTQLGRLLAALSLAAYATLGVFGHSLHGLLPCADELCQRVVALAEGDCCSGCCHAASVAADRSRFSDGPAIAEARRGHDVHECSLCTLLAKIKVGQATVFRAEARVTRAFAAAFQAPALDVAELNLSGAPRGPPIG
jgi:hypothetical protein